MKDNQQHIIVASHRRSGTHLTIDSIINNFPALANNPDIEEVNLDNLMPRVEPENRKTAAQMHKTLEQFPRVLKTHAHGDIEKFFAHSQEVSELIQTLFSNAKIIYVHRDGRDVLTSQYFFCQVFNEAVRKISFSQFLRMNNEFDANTYAGNRDRVSYWSYHVSSWLNKNHNNILFISFNDLIADLEKTLTEISQFIDRPLTAQIKDVRMAAKKQTSGDRDGELKHTSVCFRKGEIGDWVNYFDREDIEYFNSRAGETNKILGYQHTETSELLL